MPSLLSAVSRVTERTVASVVWRALCTTGLFTITLGAALGAIGFGAAGLYLLIAVRLPPATATLTTAGVLLVVAALGTWWLHRFVYGSSRGSSAAEEVSEALESLSLENMAAAMERPLRETVSKRPVASLATCVAIGMIASIFGTRRRR